MFSQSREAHEPCMRQCSLGARRRRVRIEKGADEVLGWGCGVLGPKDHINAFTWPLRTFVGNMDRVSVVKIHPRLCRLLHHFLHIICPERRVSSE